MPKTVVAYNNVRLFMIFYLHKRHVHVVYPQLIHKATDCGINSIKVTCSQNIMILLCCFTVVVLIDVVCASQNPFYERHVLSVTSYLTRMGDR